MKIRKDHLETWNELVTMEPMLEELRQEVIGAKHPEGKGFCARAYWDGNYYGRPKIKDKMKVFVGWGSELSSGKFYDAVHDVLYYSLPECTGNCSCLR